MTRAISRSGPNQAHAKIDDDGVDGVFKFDGTVIRGTLGTMTPDEFSFRVWAQMMDIKLSERTLRQRWPAAKEKFLEAARDAATHEFLDSRQKSLEACR